MLRTIRRFVLLALAGLLPLLAGCANPTPLDRGVVMDICDPTLEPYGQPWQTEIARRFPSNTVGVLLHGGNFLDGQWIVLSHPESQHPIELIADFIHEEQVHYPGQRLVILACNPGHIALHGFNNVYFSPDLTWCLPDRAIEQDSGLDQFKMLGPSIPWVHVGLTTRPVVVHNRWQDDSGPVGNIFEFLSAE